MFRPSTSERWYWSLPRKYTGNQIKSYGGRLVFTQRFTQRPQAVYVPDQDIIITGNGVTIYWSNPQAQIPDVANVSVILISLFHFECVSTHFAFLLLITLYLFDSDFLKPVYPILKL